MFLTTSATAKNATMHFTAVRILIIFTALDATQRFFTISIKQTSGIKSPEVFSAVLRKIFGSAERFHPLYQSFAAILSTIRASDAVILPSEFISAKTFCFSVKLSIFAEYLRTSLAS